MDESDVTTLFRGYGDGCRHIASDRITSDGEAGGVEAFARAVLGNPSRGSVRLLDRDRIMRFGGPIVLDERNRGIHTDALLAGAAALLTKPCPPLKLLGTIRAAVDRSMTASRFK